MPVSIGRAATNAMGAPTQSNTPNARVISAGTCSPAESIINHELMPCAAAITTGPATFSCGMSIRHRFET